MDVCAPWFDVYNSVRMTEYLKNKCVNSLRMTNQFEDDLTRMLQQL